MFKGGLYKHKYEGRRGLVLWNTRVKDDEGHDIFIRRCDFKNYLTEDFYRALRIFAMSENLGCLPFSGGWAEQPADLMEVIELFKIEENTWEQEEIEKSKNKK